jgi:hypothetical protein
VSANNFPIASTQRWPSIAALLEQAGHITVGCVPPIDGVAIAASEHALLATIVRHEGESLDELLQRLDEAIGRALHDGVHTNEIEGGEFMLAGPRTKPRGADDT